MNPPDYKQQLNIKPDAYLCKWQDGGVAVTFAPANPEKATSHPLYALTGDEAALITQRRAEARQRAMEEKFQLDAMLVAGQYWTWLAGRDPVPVKLFGTPSPDGFDYSPPPNAGYTSHDMWHAVKRIFEAAKYVNMEGKF